MFAKFTQALLVALLFTMASSVMAKDLEAKFDTTKEADLIVLQPLQDASAYTLKVQGADTFFTQEFNGDQSILIELNDPNGAPLKDGLYTYEIVTTPLLSQLDRADAKTMSSQERFRMGQDIVRTSPFNGTFRISNGEIVLDQEEPTFARFGKDEPVDDSDTGRDQVIIDDLIVNGGSACIGMDCVNGESFGFDTLRLKENNLRIHFQDTSNSASFPTNDWRIVANDSSNGGSNYLAIEDSNAGRQPFRVEAGAPASSLYVEDGGRIGIGTATPVVELHVVNGDSPTLRLEQDGSSGFTPQTWDVAGNETNFFVRDATNGSPLPFRIRPSAPDASIFIDTDGDVGLGDSSPDAALDINAGDLLVNNGGATLQGDAPVLFIDDTSASSDNTTQVMELRSQSPVQFQMSITNANLRAWAFKVGYNDFSIKENTTNGQASLLQILEGGGLRLRGNTAGDSPTATDLFEVQSDGTGRLNGALITTSDVTAKENLGMVDPMSILAKVNELPIARWQYLKDECATDHIGPMSQDFHELFGLGRDDKGIANIDTAGVALASIQALSQQVESKDAEIAALKAESAELKAKSDALEARLAALEKALLNK